MQMYNSSKKATENTVDELTGEQLTFENVVVCFADMDAYAGDSHDVQEVQYIKGGNAYLFTRGGVQVGRWEKTYQVRRRDDPQPGQDLLCTGGQRRAEQFQLPVSP